MPSPEVDMLCDFNCPAINHKMFVLESSGSDIWDSEYAFKAELDTFDQGLAIDGTYLQHETGLYHIYSCWYSKYMSWPSLLCIDKSKSPDSAKTRTYFLQCQTRGPSLALLRNGPSFLLRTNLGRKRRMAALSTFACLRTKVPNS